MVESLSIKAVGVLPSFMAILCCAISTVLPAKSDSDVMFCLQKLSELRINISLVY